jgi:outer membrane protein TolC
MIATKAERASAEDAFRDAADKLANAEKSLDDSVANALAQLDSLIRSLRMQVLSSELSDANLGVARIKFGYGEMLQYELDSEVNSVSQAHDKVTKAREDLYVQVLKIESMIGRDVVDMLRQAGLK